MIWTTESSTVFADAPGYMARIPIEGGAIGGYWEIGRFTIAMTPASIMAIAMTQAKTGRLRKKPDMAAPLLRRRPCRRGFGLRGCTRRGPGLGDRGERHRLHVGAGADPLEALDDDAVA